MKDLSNEELISYRDDYMAFMNLYPTDEQKEALFKTWPCGGRV